MENTISLETSKVASCKISPLLINGNRQIKNSQDESC